MSVRQETVRLSVEGNFTSEMARNAASVALLNKELDRLDGSNVRASRSTNAFEKDVARTTSTVDKGGASIDKYSGRLSLLAQTAAVLGPGLIPIAAVGVPAVTGLAAGLAAAAAGGGSLLAALSGVGDAMKAIDKWQTEPTAENLAKAQEAMKKLGPDARNFVREMQAFQPVLSDLRDAAAAGWFPGLTESLDDFAHLAPRVAEMLEAVGRAGGDAVAEAADSFDSGRWMPFFDFLTVEMPSAITQLARITGDLAHGAAEMWMSFDPANDQFLDWLGNVADGFDDWARSGEGRRDVESFLAYVQETGPQVEELFLALVNALTQITQAAAPLSGPVLSSLTALANVLGAIADSDLGTPIFAGLAALSLYNRALATTAALKNSAFGQVATGAAVRGSGKNDVSTLSVGGVLGGQVSGIRSSIPTLKEFGTTMAFAGQSAKVASANTLAARESVRGFAKAATPGIAAGAGLALSYSGVAEKAGLSNTTMLASMGLMAGGWGAAVGGGIGLLLDFAKANDATYEAITQVNSALDAGSISGAASAFADAGSEFDAFRKKVEQDGLGWSALANPGAALANTKNEIESWFGGTSDVEEQAAALASVQARMESTAQAAAGLADAMNINIGPVDGSAASYRELDEVLRSAQPQMDALRITQDDLTNAFKMQQNATGDGPFAWVGKTVPGAATAFDKMTNAIARATPGTEAYSRTALGMRDAARQAAASLAAVRSEARDTAGSFSDFSRSTDAAKESLGGWLNSLEDQADALRNFTINTVAAGENGVKKGLIDQLRDLGPEGAKQMRWLANATEEQVDRANRAWRRLSRGASDYADTVTGVPELNVRVQDADGIARIKRIQGLLGKFGMTKAEATAFLNDAATNKTKAVQRLIDEYGVSKGEATALLRDLASGAISKVRSELRALNGDRAITYVETRHISVGNPAGRAANPTLNADGGSVPKTGLGYADRHPYLLADGEEVISNRHGQADRHRSLLKAINNNMLADGGTVGFIRGLADGGTANGSSDNDTGPAGREARNTARHLKALNAQLDKATSLLEKESQARQEVIQRVAGGFLNDPFAASEGSGDIWSSGATAAGQINPLAALRADIKNADQYRAITRQLRKKGLDGAALGEVDTLEEAQALRGYSRSQLRTYERLYDTRARSASAAGRANADGSAATVAELQVLRAEVRGLRADVRAADKANQRAQDKAADKVGDHVNGAANKAGRDGKKP